MRTLQANAHHNGAAGMEETLAHVANWEQNWDREIARQAKDPAFNLVPNATLREDDFKAIQEGFKDLQRHQLVGISDIQERGLAFSESIYKTIVQVHDVSEMEPAEIGLNPTKFDNDDTVYGTNAVPLPIIHKTFTVPYRQEGFDYKREKGSTEAMRQVLEKSDDLVFNGDSNISVVVNGALAPVYGYTTQPNRTTGSMSDWSAATTNVLANVSSMWESMVNTNKLGLRAKSLVLYLPYDFWTPLKDDAFSAKGDRSFEEQILKRYPSIAKIQPTESLTGGASGEAVLVSLEASNVQMAVAQSPIVVPHQKTMPLQGQRFTAYAAWTPFLHEDSNSLTGIVHYSV